MSGSGWSWVIGHVSLWGTAHPRSDLWRKATLNVSILWIPLTCLQLQVPIFIKKISSLFLGWTAGHLFWRLAGIRFPIRILIIHSRAFLFRMGAITTDRAITRDALCSTSKLIPGLLSLSLLTGVISWDKARGPCLVAPCSAPRMLLCHVTPLHS